MKLTMIIMAAICGMFIILGGCVVGAKNTAISLEETVQTSKSDIDVQLSNRFNKLTELAECVKKYDEHEYKTLVEVIAARGKNMSNSEAKQCLAAFSRVEERYPELRSQENYKNLMTEISLTENHLAQHKKAYNSFIKDYRKHCRSFPASIFLSFCGYEMIDFEYYKADEAVNDKKPLKLF